MFDLTKLTPVITHLQKISNRFDNRGKEIIITCPFPHCDDINSSHGHMYLATNYPVFNCFKCSSSGTLVRLLIETGFDDEETLKYISSFIKYNYTKDYFWNNKRKSNETIIKLKRELIKQNLNFQHNNKDQFNIYIEYLISRLGKVDFTDFLIIPTDFKNNLCCGFYNSDSELVLKRIINSENKFRYHIEKQDTSYYFQEKNFDLYNRIVMTEGPFDILSLFLYNIEFQNCFFNSVNGKKYISTLEKLLCTELLLGHYEINIVFDNDVKNIQMIMHRCEILTKNYNQNIYMRYWLPVLKKDVGEFSAVYEIDLKSSYKNKIKGV
jgi:hypothetical protein